MTDSHVYLHELEIQAVARCYWKLVGGWVAYLLLLPLSALGCLVIQDFLDQKTQLSW